MSTNATIGIKKDANKFRAIYNHWDGYPEYVGAILVAHYTSVSKINDLLALGAISILKERVAPLGSVDSMTHTFDNPVPNVTVAYHRDRGDKKIRAENFKIIEKRGDLFTDKRCYGDNLYLYDPIKQKWEFYVVLGTSKGICEYNYNKNELIKKAVTLGYMSPPKNFNALNKG